MNPRPVLLSFAVTLAGLWLSAAAFAQAAPPASGPAEKPAPAVSPPEKEKPVPVAPSASQEKAAANGPRLEVVREKTVYVPYGNLDDVFEKKGRGVFLPYEEFLELWRAVRPRPPAPKPDLPPADAVIRGGKYVGAVDGAVTRFEVSYGVEALKEGWSELSLPFADVAIESVTLNDPAALFSSDGKSYRLLLPGKGHYEARMGFSVRVASSPGKKAVSFGIPPVAVSQLELTIPEEEVRVTVVPTTAATSTQAIEGKTRLSAFVGNASRIEISWTPPVGRATEAAAVLFAEQSIRTFVGERNLRLSTELDYNVERGVVDTLRVKTPAGMGLLSVQGENIRLWEQEGDVLTVQLHSPVKKEYSLKLNFERILQETPETLSLPLPVVQDVRRESGLLALSHDPGLKLRISSAAGLSQLDPEEVPEDLRGRLGFRYLAPPPPLELEVETIVPAVRSSTTSVITLGQEEDTWVGFVDYTITRAGLFALELRVPQRWSVVEIGDPAKVEDFQTAQAPGGNLRAITVKLKKRALGKFRLSFRLTADGSAAVNEIELTPPRVVGTEQDRGLFALTAPRSLELTTVEKTRMRSTDVQELIRSGIMGQVSAETQTPTTYAYHDNSPDQTASVKIGVKSRKEEINVDVQLLVEVADDRLKFTHYLDYEILYKEVESLKFTAPAELDEKLKIESRDIKEQRKTTAADGSTVWEAVLQAPTLGNVTLTISYDQELKALETAKPFSFAVPLLRPAAGVSSEKGSVAIRRTGTLEIQPQPSDMETVDASRLPDKLRRGKIHTALRYLGAEPKLELRLTKYHYERLATTVINLMYLKSVLSDQPCKLTTRATLLVRNLDRPNLELEFPEDASILDLWVGDKRERTKRKEGLHLVPIPSAQGGDSRRSEPFPVVVVYSVPLGRGAMRPFDSLTLESIEVRGDVPVERVEVDLYVPPDFRYLRWSGNVKLEEGRPEIPIEGARKDSYELPTRFLERYPFSSFAPSPRIGVIYCSPAFYRFLEGLGFVVVLAAGLLLSLQVGLSKLWTSVGCVALPLVIALFLEPPLQEIFVVACIGGALVALVFAAEWSWTRYRDWRGARRALAPDPFLEEAEARKEETRERPEREETEQPERVQPPAEEKPPAKKTRRKKRGPEGSEPGAKK